MARAADFRLSAGFRTHPKILKLEKRLGQAGVLAWISLLGHAAQYKPDGYFSGMDHEDVGLAAHWSEDFDLLVQTLVELRLLDGGNPVLSLHDWVEHNGYAASFSKRSARARKGAAAKWRKYRKSTTAKADLSVIIPPAQAEQKQSTSNAQADNKQCGSYAPSPLPSPNPDPIPKPKSEPPAVIPPLNGRTRTVREKKPESLWPWADEDAPPNWWDSQAGKLGVNPEKEWRRWKNDALARNFRYANWKHAGLNRLERAVEQGRTEALGGSSGAAVQEFNEYKREIGL